MKHRRVLTAAALLLALPSQNSAFAQDAKKEEAPKDPPKAATSEHVAKAGPFKIEFELDALFTAGREHRISLTPKAWSDMTVLSVVPHGTRVRAGDRLITLDTEKLERAIEAMEKGEPGARLALQVMERELASLEKATPMQLENARRVKRQADEDWAHYERVGHAEALKSAERSLQFAEQNLDYSREEFEQLKKMYEADDLTEETEEIILRRAKTSYERAVEGMRLARMRVDREIKVFIPRQRVFNKANVESGALLYADTVQGLPRQLDAKRHEVAKAKRDRDDALRKLRDMKADLAAFDVRSPADGIAYYGLSKAGQWITAPVVTKKLIPGGKLGSREVFITVAETGSLGLTATVPEDKLGHLRGGLSGTAVPVSNPSLRIPAKIGRIGYVPGALTTTFSIETDNDRLFPGMKAKVKLTPADFESVITVPNAMLDGSTVWVMEGEEKKQREVRLGSTDGKLTVVRSGLKEGDKVVAK